MLFLFYLFVGVVAINCCYYLLFGFFSFSKNTSNTVNTTAPVSVIICAKNEAENLKKNIPLLLTQQHPAFELILINDASKDDTLYVMEAFQKQDKRIQIVDVVPNETFWASKKYALTLGIKRAKHTHLLFTDADCKPDTPHWISQMTSSLDEKTQLVLGYGRYEKSKGLLNRMIRFETVVTALQYFSYAKAGIPYMGVGRNMSYTASLFYSVNGFISHIKMPSGDDDLFVNEAGSAQNTITNTHPDSFTVSLPKKTWSAWRLQKRRHITTASLYKMKHQLLLGTYFMSSLSFWLLAPLCFVFCTWQWTTLLVAVRIFMQYLFIGKAAIKLKEKDTLYFIPLQELFLICFQISIFIQNSISKPNRWK